MIKEAVFIVNMASRFNWNMIPCRESYGFTLYYMVLGGQTAEFVEVNVDLAGKMLNFEVGNKQC